MPIDMKAIRERAEAATPGPWKTFAELSDEEAGTCDRGPYGTIWVARGLGEDKHSMCVGDSHLEDCGAADATFIAHARQDVPALLALVDQLTAALVRLEFVGGTNGNCPQCDTPKRGFYFPGQEPPIGPTWHREACPIDAALTAAGLDTRGKRDAARKELER